jgi:hypothetical protein
MIRAITNTETVEDRYAGLESEGALEILTEGTLLGEPELLTILVDLIMQITQGEPAETRDGAFSQALAWSAEPEWVGEASEALSETGAGGREPEGQAS